MMETYLYWFFVFGILIVVGLLGLIFGVENIYNVQKKILIQLKLKNQRDSYKDNPPKGNRFPGTGDH